MSDPSLPPLVSVVIPSLNQGAYIEQAIASVLSQSYPRIELIVMDGGSTDGTVAILKRHAKRLRHWQSVPDQGPAAALNDGFSHASGELFGVLNADDFYLPGALATVVKAFEDRRADVVSGHGFFAHASGELGARVYSDRWSINRFRYGACVLLQPATLFRRELFHRAGGFRHSGRVCWDMELWLDMATRGARFSLIDRDLAAFRLHESSITGSDVHRADRRRHAREVMAEARGRGETSGDRILHSAYRLLKFATHPWRTIRQRVFFRAALNRWSL